MAFCCESNAASVVLLLSCFEEVENTTSAYVPMREIFGQDLSHSSKYKNKVLNQCVYMHSLILVRNPLFSIYYY